MSSKAFLAFFSYTSALVANIHVVVAAIALFLLLRIILRFPKARMHRRWAIAYFVAMTIGFVHRIYYDARLFPHTQWPPAATVLSYVFGWIESFVWIYGHVQLWKAFRTLARQHTETLKDMPFEDWAMPAPPVSNPWDGSRI